MLVTELTEFTTNLTREIGDRLKQDFGHVSGEEKSDGSLVTRADRWADDTIKAAIAKKFPQHGILSEEGETILAEEEFTWVIDPLDGTTNFARGIPLWGISIALLYRQQPVFGCVYLPPIDRLFLGCHPGDSGLDLPTIATENDRPIAVSKATADREALPQANRNQLFSLCARSLKTWQPNFPCKIRMLGVATYNFLCVANGTMLGAVEATPKIWDLAAVYPIIAAAGGHWHSLRTEATFPHLPARDYGSYPLPTLILNNPAAESLFLPYLSSLEING
jgi:myo-inositol-1(or 4)-monophosphatase